MRKQLVPYASLPGESLASQAMKALASELIQLHNHLAQQEETVCPSETLELFSDAADAAALVIVSPSFGVTGIASTRNNALSVVSK